MKKLICLAVAALAIGGCAVPAKKVQLTSQFSYDEAIKKIAPGKGTVKGSALLRQNGGGVVTCAGNEVSLIPVTGYSYERIVAIYGSSESGYATSAPMFEGVDGEYKRAMLTTRCDAQGYFKFENVGSGDFFVTTSVLWKVQYAMNGGALMQRVSISGDETKELVLTAK